MAGFPVKSFTFLCGEGRLKLAHSSIFKQTVEYTLQYGTFNDKLPFNRSHLRCETDSRQVNGAHVAYFTIDK